MSELAAFVLDRLADDEAAAAAMPDPADRTERLAECRAMRELARRCLTGGGPGRDVATEVLRALALPYAAHPDYSPGWRPGRTDGGSATTPVGDERRPFSGRVLR